LELDALAVSRVHIVSSTKVNEGQFADDWLNALGLVPYAHVITALDGFVTFDSYPMHVTSLPLIII
jgi:ADP-heptose:LPS heptosyltransferase